MPGFDDSRDGECGEDGVVGQLEREYVAEEPAALELVGQETCERRHEE